MAQQIQFIYLTQSDYDNLTPQTSKIYFTSDTKRIYKGSDLYAATTFDQLNFNSIEASSITVDGDPVSVEGHTHPASEVTGLQSVLDGLSSTYALASHSHAISDVTGLPAIASGITSSSIEKENGQFVNLNAINLSVSQLTVDATVVSANSMTVGGSNVSVEGHTHTMSEIEGLASGISGIESSISTLESSISTLESSVSAMTTTLSGISETGISKQSATFQTLTVTGEVTMSLSSVDFQNINASSLTVNGSDVSLEGHSHSASEISGLDAAISAATSSFALTGHTHVVSEITDLDTTTFASSNHTHPELSGLTSSTITKDTGTFTNLVVASASFTATNVEAEEISASTATFGDINVTGTASLNATHVSASTLTADSGTFTNLTVGGSSVALVGHTHPASEVTGLQSVLDGLSSTYASVSHGHAISDITNLSTILTGITESGIEKDTVTADIGYFRLLSVSGSANFAVNTVSANAVTVNGTEVALQGHGHSVADISDFGTALSAATSNFASVQHSHGMSDITGLENTLSAFASSGHSHVELAGITSSTIDKDSGNFVTLSASTATFETMTVSGSATFDITNLVADAITVSDLNLTGTLSVSSTAISAMTVTDMSVTGTLTLNSKSIATQEYVQLMISQAIGQILASAY